MYSRWTGTLLEGESFPGVLSLDSSLASLSSSWDKLGTVTKREFLPFGYSGRMISLVIPVQQIRYNEALGFFLALRSRVKSCPCQILFKYFAR